MRTLTVLFLSLVLAASAFAGGLKKGENEVTLRASYSDTDAGSADGVDFGSVKDTELAISYGWLLTDNHELGLICGYSKTDIDGGTFGMSEELDGTTLGGFYNFNFKTGGDVTPYLGASIATLGGDLGDFYDFRYGVEIGIKFFPFKHGGFSAGLGYSEDKSDAAGLPDSDTVSLGVGLILKY